MRACPECKSFYPDGAVTCARDGSELVDVSSQQERTASIQIDSDVYRAAEGSSFSPSSSSPSSSATDETRAASPAASRTGGSTPSDVPILVSEPLFASQGSWQAPARPKKRKRGATAHDRAEARLGEVLGSYRLVEVLGLGGMGTVYRAEHVKLGREVALKLLHQDYAQRRDAVTRFFQEARAVNKIRHRNIVDITDLVELDDGTTFLVMELLRGVPLTKLMRGAGGLVVPRAMAILVQICDGLSAAHSVGIVHRDLKPDNIFIVVTPDGADEVKLVDFGVAKLVGTDHTKVSTHTVAGAVIGTPAFMSPEQAGGLKVDARSDVYALGAIMFEIFAGRPLFRGKSFSDYVRMHLNDPAPLMKTDADGTAVDPRIEEIVQKCLKKSPEQRYQSAEALRTDLLELLAELGGTDPRTAEEIVLTGPDEEPTLAARQLTPPAPSGPSESGPMPPPPSGSYPHPGGSPTPPPSGPSAPEGPVAPSSGALQALEPSPGPLRSLSPQAWHAVSGGYAPQSGEAFPPPAGVGSSEAMAPLAGLPASGASPGLDTALTAGDLPRDPTQQRGPFRWPLVVGGAVALAAGLGIALLLVGGDGETESAAARGAEPAASADPPSGAGALDPAEPGDRAGAAEEEEEKEGTEEGNDEPGGPETSPLPIVTPIGDKGEEAHRPGPITVRLVSEPRAAVFPSGDTEAACTTPCDLTIDPEDGGSSRREFLVRRAGYRDEIVTVHLEAPEDVIEVALEPQEEPETGAPQPRTARSERKSRRGGARRTGGDSKRRNGGAGGSGDEAGGEAGSAVGTKEKEKEKEDEEEEEEEDPGRPYDPDDTMNPFGSR